MRLLVTTIVTVVSSAVALAVVFRVKEIKDVLVGEPEKPLPFVIKVNQPQFKLT